MNGGNPEKGVGDDENKKEKQAKKKQGKENPARRKGHGAVTSERKKRGVEQARGERGSQANNPDPLCDAGERRRR